ncbi:hypothetical protein [Desulfopila sp. IMCC35008]|uniref:hypothetical protein n=1 Tax=Desulfopila sp. IMCC35008 TaxID=2653858 RepID=UPI0013D4EC9D|nr:hypothetical protein [Desulfopila sp. IMCC35008]
MENWKDIDPRIYLQTIDQRLSLLHHTLYNASRNSLTENILSAMILNIEDIQQDLAIPMQYCEDAEGFLWPLQDKLENGPQITSTLFELLVNIDPGGKIQEHLFRQLIDDKGEVKREILAIES